MNNIVNIRNKFDCVCDGFCYELEEQMRRANHFGPKLPHRVRDNLTSVTHNLCLAAFTISARYKKELDGILENPNVPTAEKEAAKTTLQYMSNRLQSIVDGFTAGVQ